MSKPLEQMTTDELSRYMKEHYDDREEWQKAYSLFAQKSDWQDAPEGATWEEQMKFAEDFVSQVVN